MRRILLTAVTLALLAPAGLAALPATQPTKVKLFVEAEDPREAAKQITRQLGLQVRLDPGAGVIQVDSGGEKPYAAAVADLLQQANLAPASNFSGLTLTHNENARIVPLGETAVMAMNGVNVNAQHTLTAGNDSYTYRYELLGTVFFDPALKIVGVMREAKADQIDADTSMQPAENGPGNASYLLMNAMTGGDAPGRVSISFVTRSPITHLKSVTARLRAIQAVEEASVDLSAEDVGSNKKVDGQGVSATLTVDNPDPRRATLTVRLFGPVIDKYRNGPWMQAISRFVSIYDVNGDLLAVDHQGWQPESGNGVRLQFRPNNNPTFFDDLANVKVRVPTKIKTIDIRVELKDLDLQLK